MSTKESKPKPDYQIAVKWKGVWYYWNQFAQNFNLKSGAVFYSLESANNEYTYALDYAKQIDKTMHPIIVEANKPSV